MLMPDDDGVTASRLFCGGPKGAGVEQCTCSAGVSEDRLEQHTCICASSRLLPSPSGASVPPPLHSEDLLRNLLLLKCSPGSGNQVTSSHSDTQDTMLKRVNSAP